MKTTDIRRVIDKGLANVATTSRDVDAVMVHVKNSSGKRRRHVRRISVTIVVLTTIMITLFLSVIVQALGMSVWSVFVTTAEDNPDHTDEYIQQSVDVRIAPNPAKDFTSCHDAANNEIRTSSGR